MGLNHSSLQIGGEPWAEVLVSEESDLASVDIAKAKGFKCERCWHYLPDVGLNANHPDICGRCVSSLQLKEERRTYA